MKKLFNITDTEKERILEMHINATKNQYLTEQISAKEFKASTDSTRMYNFPNKNAKSSNSKFGLNGTPEQENYYFESTIADIVNKSRGSENEYLINFKPLNNAGEYVDYLKIGNVEINGSGTQTFDINKNMKVTATHNGLLAIKRLMDSMNGMGYNGEKAKATITIAGTERSSDYKTYNPDAAKNIVPLCGVLMRHFAVLIVSDDKRETNINQSVDEYVKKMTTNELKNYILNIIDSNLVVPFLPNPKEWRLVKEQYRLKGSESTNYQTLFNKAEFNREGNSLNQENWDNFWSSWKRAYIDNYSVYVRDKYPNTAQSLITDLSNSIANKKCNYNLKEMFDNLFKKVVVSSGTGVQNKQSTGKKNYDSGN